MPDPNRNQVRAIWIKSIQALNEKLNAPRNSFLPLLLFRFHGTQWPGMIFEHLFCNVCLCDHSPIWKHIGLILFRSYRRLEEKWSGACREWGSACLKNGSPWRGARAQESLPSPGRRLGWVNAQKRALERSLTRSLQAGSEKWEDLRSCRTNVSPPDIEKGEGNLREVSRDKHLGFTYRLNSF